MLKATLRSVAAERFAVIDGAFFDDLRGSLVTHGLKARPLYLDETGYTAAAAGPFLVSLDSERTLDRTLVLLGGLNAAVFWSWNTEEKSLFEHLRRLSRAQLPLEEGDARGSYESVVFRHADPIVLADILSIADERQYDTILSAAPLVAMASEEEPSLLVFHRSDRDRTAPAYPVRLRQDQLGLLSQRKLTRSRKHVVRYLRDVTPMQTDQFDDDQLLERVTVYEECGRAHGIQSEAAHMKWAYLMTISDGEIAENDGTRRFLTKGSGPDQQLHRLMTQMDAMWRALD